MSEALSDQVIYSDGDFELRANVRNILVSIKNYDKMEEVASERWLSDNNLEMLWWSKHYSVKGRVARLELAKSALFKTNLGKPLGVSTKRMICLYCDKIQEFANDLLEMDSLGVEKNYITEQHYISHANNLKHWVETLMDTKRIISAMN
jgi:hypothetical protein